MSQDAVNPDEFAGETPENSGGPGRPESTGADQTAPAGSPEEEAVVPVEQDPNAQLEATVAELEQAKEDLARARADLYNLNQEYGNYVRRAKSEGTAQRQLGQEEVAEALLGVLDDISAAREAGELGTGPFASIATKLEETLASRFHLERYGAEGDPFDPQLHEALMAQTNPDIEHPVIKQVLQPGYRINDRVLRATKVMVDNPE